MIPTAHYLFEAGAATRGTEVKCNRSRSAVLQLDTTAGCGKGSAAAAGAGPEAQGGCKLICVSSALPEAMHRQAWSLRDFELTRQLYRGKLSIVFAALDKVSGKQVVLKLYRKRKLTALNWYQVEREISIHCKLEHESIVKLYAAFEDDKLIYLVQELVPGGDLFDALGRLKDHPREKDVVQGVLVPMMHALQYMHAAGIIHRDIKPENILLQCPTLPARGVKLADFGMAINSLQERPVSRVGTLDYMAPEVLICPDKTNPGDNKENPLIGYTARVDSWALGILAFEMLVGLPPFENQSRTETYDRIMYKDPALPAGMSEDAKSFIRMTLCKNASQRPTISELFQHPWVVRNATPEQLVDRTPAPAAGAAVTVSRASTARARLQLTIASPTGAVSGCVRPSGSPSGSSDPECLSPDSLRKAKPQDPLRPTLAAAARSPARPSSQQASVLHKVVLAQPGTWSPNTGGSRSPSCRGPAAAERQHAPGLRQPCPPCEPGHASPRQGSRRTTANGVGSVVLSSSASTPSPAASACTPSPAGDKANHQADVLPHWMAGGLATHAKARSNQPWYLASGTTPGAPAPDAASGRSSEGGDGEARSCGSAEMLKALPSESRGGRGSTGQLRVEIPAQFEQLGDVALSMPDPTGSPTSPKLSPHPPQACLSSSSAAALKSPFSAQPPAPSFPDAPAAPAAAQRQQPQGCVAGASGAAEANSEAVRPPLVCPPRGVLCEAPSRLRSFSLPGTAAPSPVKPSAPADQAGTPAAAFPRSRSVRIAVQPGLQAASSELHSYSSDSGPTRAAASMPGNVALPGSPLGGSSSSGMGLTLGSPLSRAGMMSPGSSMRASSRFAELTGVQRIVAGPPRKPARTFPSTSLSSPSFIRVSARLEGCSGSGSGDAIHRALSMENLEERDSLTLDFSPSVRIPRDLQEGKACRYGGGAQEGCRRVAAAQQGEQEGGAGTGSRPCSDGLMMLLPASEACSSRA